MRTPTLGRIRYRGIMSEKDDNCSANGLAASAKKHLDVWIGMSGIVIGGLVAWGANTATVYQHGTRLDTHDQKFDRIFESQMQSSTTLSSIQEQVRFLVDSERRRIDRDERDRDRRIAPSVR